MKLMYVTKKGCCAFCGAKVRMCIICQDFFHASKTSHVVCGGGCRSAKFRLDAKEKAARKAAIEAGELMPKSIKT